MKIFVTGATGYIGFAVCGALKARGHEVTGLTRGAKGAERLASAGIQPVVGDMKTPQTYESEAEHAEVLIHAAVEYGPATADADRTALESLISVARGAGAPRGLVYTSGVWVLGPRPATAADENSALDPLPIVAWRPAQEQRCLGAAGDGVRTVVIRPGCVYGGHGGLYGQMIADLDDETLDETYS